MFLEPESGLAWYDTGAKNLELGVPAAQRPQDRREDFLRRLVRKHIID
jgi:hypothetical protein